MVTQQSMLRADLQCGAFLNSSYPVHGSNWLSVSNLERDLHRRKAHTNCTGPLAVLNIDRHRFTKKKHASGLTLKQL